MQENYNATNSRAWMIPDSEDGKIPATTEEVQKARRRAQRVAAATATTPACFDGVLRT